MLQLSKGDTPTKKLSTSERWMSEYATLDCIAAVACVANLMSPWPIPLMEKDANIECHLECQSFMHLIMHNTDDFFFFFIVLTLLGQAESCRALNVSNLAQMRFVPGKWFSRTRMVMAYFLLMVITLVTFKLGC